jgi:hypothetical protein
MSDYSAKVHNDVGGDSLTVDAGGNIVLGNATFAVDASGKLIVTLPTTNPNVAGALYSNSGVLTISTGA